MAGLLDYIFTNLDQRQLTRQEILAHLCYLNEIITPEMSVEDQVKYLGYKIKLGRKLTELDKRQYFSSTYISPLSPQQTSQLLSWNS